ncbi:aminotransferase class V-fold PLP-dependent enzyme [Pirellulales bacterium]|nr:aminotransferase class V-fold PLP-dependent enzyme [Pirellulales bacterium]
MAARVYLDTARMGRVSPAAMSIQTDYLRFAAARGCPEALLNLMKNGGDAWPECRRRCFPDLATWRGVDPLKRRLREIIGAESDASMLLASRPQTLMKLASHLLFRAAETVATADVGWPSYHGILRHAAQRLGRRVIEIPLRHMIHRGADVSAIADTVSAGMLEHGAQALFLPAISHDGIQLPITEIAAAVSRRCDLRFVAIDGAQHTAHGAVPVREMNCDFYLGGAHKWLRGLYPLGIGVYGRPRTRKFIDTTVRRLRAAGRLDDPILRFTDQLEWGTLDAVTETVNLSGLLSTHGAAFDARNFSRRASILEVQQQNAAKICELARRRGWAPVQTAAPMQSGILLLQRRVSRPTRGVKLRKMFGSRGVVLSAYDTGRVRLSMPRRSLDGERLSRVGRALQYAICG